MKVDSVVLTGFAQKGPFEKGSAVTLYGLDSLLEKTKTKFTGKVAGDSGAFKVERISLPNQYALVEVNGSYTSEASGKKTGGKSTLKAIVDLSGDKSVKTNINIFTELEYARVKYLVTKEKFNVPAAKKRATKELLALFGMGITDSVDANLSSTDLSLMDSTAAGTALLSASILLPGELSAARFTGRLSDIAEIFATTGKLDSAEIRADLADWTSRVDSTDNFKSIRENLEKQKLASTTPNFESVLYAFWTNEYNLGACTDSLEEKIIKNENKNSENFNAGYACINKRWHKSTKLDTDLGLCTAKREGTLEEHKREGKDSEYYVCRTGTWQEIDEVSYELKLCTEERRQELVTTEKSVSYVCEWDGSEGHWRKATEVEYRYGICTESMKGGSIDTGDSVAMLPYYPPDSSSLILTEKNIEFYRCHEGAWENVSYTVAQYGDCTADREGEMHGLIMKDTTMKIGDHTVYHTLSGFAMCQNGNWV